jgi:Transposase DNA-binding/Transposase Tn5 dimerisation domain
MQHGVVVPDWVVEEFGGLDLGDTRREGRVLEVVTQLAGRPGASLPAACGDLAALKATYRLLANAAVSREALLAGHVQATWGRVAAEPVVLVVQDTTDLDCSSHKATVGLGRVGNGHGRGLYVHSSLAITPQRLPLGLLGQQVWARPLDQPVRTISHKQRAIADKERMQWLHGLALLDGAPTQAPTTQVVSVADREADVYALCCAPRPTNVALLIRATQDRLTEQLWPAAAQPARGRRRHYTLRTWLGTPPGLPQTVAVPRRGPQRPRTAQVRVRWDQVTLCPPANRPAAPQVPVTCWAVWVQEVGAPVGVEPLDWLLLTTLSVLTDADAQRIVDYYLCRWGIEVWHKVLQSGCTFEQRQLGSAAGLARALSLYSVVAWWVLYATLLARLTPEIPCTVLLELEEWQTLYCAIHKTTTPPATPPTLGQAVRWIAQLGGFLGRTGDGDPGPLLIWQGLGRLLTMTEIFHLFTVSHRYERSG